MRNFLTIILALILFVASALFFAQNDSPVSINYFSGNTIWQLNWVMVSSLLIGFGVGIASIIGSLLKSKLQLRQLKTKVIRQESELNSLRALPIKDEY